MLIIGDQKKHSGFAWMTLVLILANITGYQAQLYFGDPLTFGYSLVPKEIIEGKDIVGGTVIPIHERVDEDTGVVISAGGTILIPHQPGPTPIYLTLLTSMFLHGNLLHLVGNMLFLFVFGRNVERAMGPLLFLIFYLLVGVAAGMTHVYVNPDGLAPYFGASGAVSGIMGAYFFLFPFNWVKVWLGPCAADLPTIVVLGAWVFLQYIGSLEAVQSGELNVGIAYWAHVGGFVAGIVFVLTMLITLKVLTLLTRKPPPRSAYVWEAAKQGPRSRLGR
jgi:rhomboid family protein